MGGAGAGAGIFFLFPLMIGAPVVWLVVALLAWILVLPRWTYAALILSLVSCCPLAVVFYAKGEPLLTKAALIVLFALSAAAVLALPAAMGFRIGTIFFAKKARKE